MDTQKLHDLIDRVIGKKGPLRAPAYWMGEVLKEVVGHITELKIWTEDAMLKLESRIKALLANVIKSIPEYTYAELKELKDKGLLIPGQKYKITDYWPFFSQSPHFFSIEEGDGAGSRGVITLEAYSQYEFLPNAIMLRKESLVDIKYSFDRDSSYEWCPRENEDFYSFKFNGATFRRLTRSQPDGNFYPSYVCYSLSSTEVGESGLEPGIYGLQRVLASSKLYKLPYTGATSVVCEFEELTDKKDLFRGFIYDYHDHEANLHIPYDPQCILKFKVDTGNRYNSVQEWENQPFEAVRGVTILSSLTARNSVYARDLKILPLVAFGSTKTYKSVLIDCNNIINSFVTDNLELSGCYQIFIKNVNGLVNLPRGSHHIYLNNGVNSVIALGPPIHHLYIMGSGNNYIAGNIIIFPNNYYLDIALSNSMVDYTILTGTNITSSSWLRLEPVNRFIGRDSNGNIRQWNPADLVPVETEEQTVETT